MEKEFIPYEQALELKELGFDEPCLRVGNSHGHTMWKWYEVDIDTVTVSVQDVLNVNYGPEWVEIPTFSQAFRFIREKYNLIGLVEGGYDNGKNIFTNTFDGYHVRVEFNNQGVNISKQLEKKVDTPNMQAPLVLPYEKLNEMDFIKQIVDYVHGVKS